MIDWLNQNPCIYSKRLTDYKDAPKKEKLREYKANAMGLEVSVLQTFCKSNRTQLSHLEKGVGKSSDMVQMTKKVHKKDK